MRSSPDPPEKNNRKDERSHLEPEHHVVRGRPGRRTGAPRCPPVDRMRRLLLLMTTASYKAAAFLDAAGRLGLPVVVGSERRQALSQANPGGHLALDFLTPEKACRAIVHFARDHPIGGVVATDDDGVILAAMAARALGLPHNPVEAVRSARDKHRTREILAGNGLLTPHFARFSIDDDPDEAARAVVYPCVLKPLSLSASRGVIRADDPVQFIAAFRRVAGIIGRSEGRPRTGTPGRHLLVETFIPGSEVSLEGLLRRGQLRVLALFDKPDPLEGPFFEETIYVTPSRLPEDVRKQIERCAADAVSALGLQEGPVHVELRVNEQGPWIIEIAPRSIGGLCSRALRFGDGASLEEVILRHALGLEASPLQRERQSSGVMMIPIPGAGVLTDVLGQEEAFSVAGIEGIRITIPLGQEVVPPPEGSKYLGFIFARGETPERVEAALREAHRRLAFVITPPAGRR